MYGKVGVCIHVCVSTISVKQVSILDPLAFLALKTLLITWLLQLHGAKNVQWVANEFTLVSVITEFLSSTAFFVRRIDNQL